MSSTLHPELEIARSFERKAEQRPGRSFGATLALPERRLLDKTESFCLLHNHWSAIPPAAWFLESSNLDIIFRGRILV